MLRTSGGPHSTKKKSQILHEIEQSMIWRLEENWHFKVDVFSIFELFVFFLISCLFFPLMLQENLWVGSLGSQIQNQFSKKSLQQLQIWIGASARMLHAAFT